MASLSIDCRAQALPYSISLTYEIMRQSGLVRTAHKSGAKINVHFTATFCKAAWLVQFSGYPFERSVNASALDLDPVKVRKKGGLLFGGV